MPLQHQRVIYLINFGASSCVIDKKSCNSF
jgi:hypothetical protein